MQVFVKSLDGRTVTLDLCSGDGVAAVKRGLEERTGLPCDEQRLLFGGRQLADEDSVQPGERSFWCAIPF